MAGDWIKWVKGFARKPEIIRMADILQLPRQHVATAYMEVAEWVDSEGYPDREEDQDSDITITLLSRCERDARAQLCAHIDEIARTNGFANALSDVGWLVVTDTEVCFKRAARHNTETAKKRALASRRQSRKRSKKKVSRNGRDVSRSKRDQRREEYVSRESVSIGESKPLKRPFGKPSVAEIAAYCAERQNGIDAHDFFDFYESKGWVVGKSPMKDWRASIRTWERKRKAASVSRVFDPQTDTWTPE